MSQHLLHVRDRMAVIAELPSASFPSTVHIRGNRIVAGLVLISKLVRSWIWLSAGLVMMQKDRKSRFMVPSRTLVRVPHLFFD